MASEIENLDSLNEEFDEVKVEDNDDIDALKEKFQKVSEEKMKLAENNRHLFARAKKGEGFELIDGRWIKPEPKKAKEPEPPPKKSDEFDEGQLAYLTAKGIESDEDIDFTRDELKKAGGTLRQLLGNEYFQAKMKSRKEAQIALNATPPSSRRSVTGATNAVDIEYAKYLKTGILPEDREMREKLVDMRRKSEGDSSQFTDQPVVGNF